MRLVPICRAEPGAVLARDVVGGRHGGRTLLRSGARLTERYRRAIVDAGFGAVYVEDEVSAGIVVSPALTEQSRATAVAGLERAFATIPRAFAARDCIPQAAIDQVGRVGALIAKEVAEADQPSMALADLCAADRYAVNHPIDVCVVGLTVAKRVFDEQGRIDYRGNRVWDRRDQWLAKLGVGLLLHDIGKLGLRRDVVDPAGRLDVNALEELRRHPLVGLDLLSSDRVSPLVRAVVRSHHERWDGKGYPHGAGGGAIPHFARITAVADVFDAVVSERPDQRAAPQHVGHRVVNDGAGTRFDPDIVRAFNQVVAPHPPGEEIVLADGRRGIVVSCPALRPDRPVVRIAWDSGGERVGLEEVDLLEREDLVPGAQPVAA